jgi:hypothetical protein
LDVISNSWTTISYPGAGLTYCATSISNKVIFSTDNYFRLLDVDLNNWSSYEYGISPTRSALSCASSASRAFFLSVKSSAGGTSSTIHVFSPASASWSSTNCGAARSHASVSVANSILFLSGGDSTVSVLDYDVACSELILSSINDIYPQASGFAEPLLFVFAYDRSLTINVRETRISSKFSTPDSGMSVAFSFNSTVVHYNPFNSPKTTIFGNLLVLFSSLQNLVFFPFTKTFCQISMNAPLSIQAAGLFPCVTILWVPILVPTPVLQILRDLVIGIAPVLPVTCVKTKLRAPLSYKMLRSLCPSGQQPGSLPLPDQRLYLLVLYRRF